MSQAQAEKKRKMSHDQEQAVETAQRRAAPLIVSEPVEREFLLDHMEAVRHFAEWTWANAFKDGIPKGPGSSTHTPATKEGVVLIPGGGLEVYIPSEHDSHAFRSCAFFEAGLKGTCARREEEAARVTSSFDVMKRIAQSFKQAFLRLLQERFGPWAVVVRDLAVLVSNQKQMPHVDVQEGAYQAMLYLSAQETATLVYQGGEQYPLDTLLQELNISLEMLNTCEDAHLLKQYISSRQLLLDGEQLKKQLLPAIPSDGEHGCLGQMVMFPGGVVHAGPAVAAGGGTVIEMARAPARCTRIALFAIGFPVCMMSPEVRLLVVAVRAIAVAV